MRKLLSLIAACAVVPSAAVLGQQSLDSQESVAARQTPTVIAMPTMFKTFTTQAPASQPHASGLQSQSTNAFFGPQFWGVGNWDVGASPNNGSPEFALFFGFAPTGNAPQAVFCQTQQSDPIDEGFPDEFECQVIQRFSDHVIVKVRRADIAGDGWGQNLNVNLLAVF